MEDPSETHLRDALARALSAFQAHDADVLRLDAHEVTVTSRLAHHLAVLIERPDEPLRVDCEYNRDRDDVKSLDDENIRPDVIVHCRDEPRNFLIVEAKKPPRTSKARQAVRADVERLIAMLGKPYRYQRAAYVEVSVDACRVWWGRDELLALLGTLP